MATSSSCIGADVCLVDAGQWVHRCTRYVMDHYCQEVEAGRLRPLQIDSQAANSGRINLLSATGMRQHLRQMVQRHAALMWQTLRQQDKGHLIMVMDGSNRKSPNAKRWKAAEGADLRSASALLYKELMGLHKVPQEISNEILPHVDHPRCSGERASNLVPVLVGKGPQSTRNLKWPWFCHKIREFIIHSVAGMVTTEVSWAEADNLIAVITREAIARGQRVSIISGDWDFMQLIPPDVSVRVYITPNTDTSNPQAQLEERTTPESENGDAYLRRCGLVGKVFANIVFSISDQEFEANPFIYRDVNALHSYLTGAGASTIARFASNVYLINIDPTRPGLNVAPHLLQELKAAAHAALA